MKLNVTLPSDTQPGLGRVVLSYFVRLLLITCACANALAQADRVCTERSVVVNVLDDRGVPAKDLSSENFRASHRGKSLTVLRSEYRQDPRGRVVVLLDVSGSMSGISGHTKWKIAHNVALEFVSSAPAQEQISLMAFAAGVKQRFGVSGGRTPIVAWLKSEEVSTGQTTKGRTALYDVIVEALASLGTAQPGDAIYLITDGGDNASKEKSSQLERLLEHSGVRLFTFLLNDSAPDDPNPLSSAGRRELYDLTRRSGGFVIATRAPAAAAGRSSFNGMYYYGKETDADIEKSTRIFEAQIVNFYLLTIQVPRISGKSDGWDLEVVDAQGRRQKSVTAVYSQGLSSGECGLQSP